MISYLRGEVLEMNADGVVLLVGGVGYELYLSGSALRSSAVGKEAAYYTQMQVKEDGITLFGFSSRREKELFQKLLSVSGVGPKMGIGILLTLSAEELVNAVALADVKRLSSVKGLGKKTAEKIVLELHGKISAAEIMDMDDETPRTLNATTRLSVEDENAVQALIGLGFKRAESVQAVRRAHEEGATTTEEVLMLAIKGGV